LTSFDTLEALEALDLISNSWKKSLVLAISDGLAGAKGSGPPIGAKLDKLNPDWLC
jgi:hypothetical protein